MNEQSTIPIPPLQSEGIIAQPLAPHVVPRHIIVLRFHAFGDAVITLPVLSGLRERYPDARIELVTSAEYVNLFSAFPMLDRVYPISFFASRPRRVLSFRKLLSSISSPDLIIDLQRSRLSRLLTRLLSPAAWSAFDRYAPAPAIERYLEATKRSGVGEISPSFSFPLFQSVQEEIDRRFAQVMPVENRERPLICLNPAGCWKTKNWPAENYVELGRQMIREWNARIILLGTENVRSGAQIIARELGEDVINLVDHTTPLEALAAVRKLSLMVSDDSGLMHLAWTSGVPTIGFFGASRTTWSRPWGEHTRYLGSEDLPCGACMSPLCERGDRICLTRISVGEAFNLSRELLEGSRTRNAADDSSSETTIGDSSQE